MTPWLSTIVFLVAKWVVTQSFYNSLICKYLTAVLLIRSIWTIFTEIAPSIFRNTLPSVSTSSPTIRASQIILKQGKINFNRFLAKMCILLKIPANPKIDNEKKNLPINIPVFSRNFSFSYAPIRSEVKTQEKILYLRQPISSLLSEQSKAPSQMKLWFTQSLFLQIFSSPFLQFG